MVKLVPVTGGKAAVICTDSFDAVYAWEDNTGKPQQPSMVFKKTFKHGWSACLNWVHKHGERYTIRIWDMQFDYREENKAKVKEAKWEQIKVHKHNIYRNIKNIKALSSCCGCC